MYIISYTVNLPKLNKPYNSDSYVRYLKSKFTVDDFNNIDKLRDKFLSLSVNYERRFTDSSCRIEYYCDHKDDCSLIKELLSSAINDSINIVWDEISHSAISKKELIFGV